MTQAPFAAAILSSQRSPLPSATHSSSCRTSGSRSRTQTPSRFITPSSSRRPRRSARGKGSTPSRSISGSTTTRVRYRPPSCPRRHTALRPALVNTALRPAVASRRSPSGERDHQAARDWLDPVLRGLLALLCRVRARGAAPRLEPALARQRGDLPAARVVSAGAVGIPRYQRRGADVCVRDGTRPPLAANRPTQTPFPFQLPNLF